MTIQEAAREYHNQGFKLVVTDKNKVPVSSWRNFMVSQTWEDIEKMFKKSNAHSISIIATDNIEVIDVDCKYDLTGRLFEDYLKAVIAALPNNDILSNVMIQRTVNGGYHVAYKANNAEGNQKLAQRETTADEKGNNPNDSKRVLLETRGEGGYFLVYPSEGYTLEELPESGDFIGEIDNESRNVFINIAKTFDECETHHKSARAQKTVPLEVKGQNKSTIEAYNENHNCYELLENEGWEFSHQRGDNYYLIRPGKSKKQGHGASYNEKLGLAYIFTSSSNLEPNKAYNPFTLFAALNYNNDYSEAAKFLYRSGYGDRLSKTRDNFQTQTAAITSGDNNLAEKVVSNDTMLRIFKESRVFIEKAVKVPDWVLSVTEQASYLNSSKTIGLGCYGDVILLTGLQKSRKTGISSSICASALGNGIDVLNFSCNNGNRKIAYIDTEQAEYQSSRLIHRIYEQAQVKKITTDRFYYQRIKKYSKQEKQRFLRWLVEYVKDIGVLILDGIVDLCEDYNDNKVSSALVTYMERLAEEFKLLIVCVLHDARSTGRARGHLGTELLNKTACHMQVVKTEEEDGGHSVISFPNTRDQQPKSFNFTHDQSGQLITVE